MEKRESRERIFTVDAAPIFAAAGLMGPEDKVEAEMNEHTYELDLAHPKDNWLYPAFRAFQNLKAKLDARKEKVGTFVTIGTGPGLDAIGGLEIFTPSEVVVTDLHPDVVPIAKRNFQRYLGTYGIPSPRFQALEGYLTEPLRQKHITADVIYANLPNVPSHDKVRLYNDQNTASYFDASKVHAPEELSRYLLAMQHTFLKNAHGSLKPGGSVVLNLGGRVPTEMVEKMFKDSGYKYEELFTTLKVQSQPEIILPGYAEAEKAGGVEFDFYYIDELLELVRQLSFDGASVRDFKRALRNYRVSASQGEELFRSRGARIGHIVQVIRGKTSAEQAPEIRMNIAKKTA